MARRDPETDSMPPDSEALPEMPGLQHPRENPETGHPEQGDRAPGFLPPLALGLIRFGVAAAVANLEGRILYANPRYHALLDDFGLSPEGAAAQGETVNQASNRASNRGGTQPRDRSATDTSAGFLPPLIPIEGIIARIREGAGEIHQLDTLQWAGGRRAIHSTHFGIHDESGTLIAIGGQYEDADSTVARLVSLDSARDRFNDIARLVSDWIWETDPEHRLTYVSSRIQEVLNLLPRSLIGRNLLDLGRFIDADGNPAPAPAQIAGRVPFRNALALMADARGRERRFSISGVPIFSEDGRFQGYRGTATDLSETTEAREIATRSQGRLTAALENISEGLALFGDDLSLQVFNRRFSALFADISRFLIPGVSYKGPAEALAERAIFDNPESSLKAWLDLPEKVGSEGEAKLAFRTTEGRWLQVNGRRTDNGGIITVFSDITEMIAREEDLRQSKEAAEQASRSKGQFLANMSHELRTPLNAIIGFSEIMHAESLGPIANERYREYLEDIIDSSRHLLGVINDILDVAKSEAGRLELHEQDVSIAHEINTTARLFADQAEKAGVTLVADPGTAESDSGGSSRPPPGLRADQRKLRQILLNLVSNSVKFTPRGGTITLAARRGAHGGLELSVCDTGIGIGAEDLPRALTPFGQVDSNLSRRYVGTGLGLPLTKSLVECHGGTMEISSTVGTGTTVTIRFPAERNLETPAGSGR